MDHQELSEMYWFETIGFGEIKSFKSLKYAVVKIDLIDCVAQIEGDQIIGGHAYLPYCFISGEDIISGETVAIAIINKVDFKNAWKIEEDYWEYDSFLEHKPVPIMSKVFPQFEFSIFKKGCNPGTSAPLFKLGRFDTT